MNTTLRFGSIATVCCLFVVCADAQTTQNEGPWFTGIGHLDGNPHVHGGGAFGVSPDGQTVVGFSSIDVFSNQAVLWTLEDGLEGLGFMFGPSTYALDVSENNVIVGYGRAPRGYEGFYWTKEDQYTTIGDLPGGMHLSAIEAVSWDGTILVGNANNEAGYVAVRWTQQNGFESLGALNQEGVFSGALDVSADGSAIVGFTATDPVGNQAFYYTDDLGMIALGDLDHQGGTNSSANGISADGHVAVGFGTRYNNGQGGREAFRWTPETGMVGLGDLPGGQLHSEALACNIDGSVIVGFGHDDHHGFHALIWTQNDGMRKIKDVLETDYGLDLSQWEELTVATDISADGRTIVGFGRHNDSPEGWVAYLGPTCRADLTHDGRINRWDWRAFSLAWDAHRTIADWNYDGTFDTKDIIAFFNDYARGCP